LAAEEIGQGDDYEIDDILTKLKDDEVGKKVLDTT
jgi:hypothetical protein